MPSFTSLLRRPRSAEDGENETSNDSGPGSNPDNGNAENLQRGLSKRRLLRRFIRPRSARSESQASRRSDEPMKRSAPNSNKPLPPPPPNETEETKPSTKATSIKLNRIIQPISLSDIHKLFSGAPQFFVRVEEFSTKPPKPGVVFPWDVELQIRDLCDYCQVENEAFTSVTAYPHIIRNLDTQGKASTITGLFPSRCHERPNMLSMQGLERGTTGFSAALEMGVADALYEEADEVTSPGTDSLAERRSNFLTQKKQGARPLTEASVLNKLLEVGELYQQPNAFQDKTPVELYTELFTQLLFPPDRVTDLKDPYSFHVQIEALIDVLATPNIWIDFSRVEWRIRLGQTLWDLSYENDERNEAISTTEGIDTLLINTQKSWLLLQIMLACELLIRLDLITKNTEQERNIVKADKLHQFEEHATQTVRWSLILARIWLENIKIESIEPTSVDKTKPASGWLAAFVGVGAAPSSPTDPTKTTAVEFRGRHLDRQISGVLHFARKINWPQVDRVAAKLSLTSAHFSDNMMNIAAVGTPSTVTTQHSSYFGSPVRSKSKYLLPQQQQLRSAAVQSAGWLSRSYISGLILPGECLGHFLITTLLENDENALGQLGDEANLYGGFVYASSSYWSVYCVVGRVLAAGKGARECMGWLSSDVLPKDVGDGWINMEVEAPPQTEGRSLEKARIWKKEVIERDGYVLGNGDISTALPGDFTLPFDEIRDNDNLQVTLESLDLRGTAHPAQDRSLGESQTPMSETKPGPGVKSYTASMTFAISSVDGVVKRMAFDIMYDVQFVTAHPCIPSQHAKNILDSPTSRSFRMPSPQRPSDPRKLGPHELFAGHPLHKSFLYKRLVLLQILNHPQRSTRIPHPLATLHTPSHEVFVISCNEPHPPSQISNDTHEVTTGSTAHKRHWGSDLEILARAWCAQMGYNALISRRGRNCIACSIREARALGWKVILRFG